MNNELKLNKSECIVSRQQLGTTDYINICTGETNKVEWGLREWSSFGVIPIIIIGLIIIIGGSVKAIKE